MTIDSNEILVKFLSNEILMRIHSKIVFDENSHFNEFLMKINSKNKFLMKIHSSKSF